MALLTSVLTGGINNHETTSEEVNALATDLVTEGILGVPTNTGGVAPMGGNFAVNQQPSPDMSVLVSSGVSYVQATPTGQGSQVFRVKSTGNETITIAANSSGSTKYDWVYLSIDPDKAANPNTAGDDVASLVVSRSSSSSTDNGTPPAYAIPLAVVTVANGASSIVDANITDKRTELSTYVAENSVTPAKWTNPYNFSATTGVSVPNSTVTVLTGWTERFDTNSDFNASTGVYTAPIKGIYGFFASGGVTDAPDNTRVIVTLRKNGAAQKEGWAVSGASVHDPVANLGVTLSLTAGDTIDVTMFHDYGSSTAVRYGGIDGWLIHAR